MFKTWIRGFRPTKVEVEVEPLPLAEPEPVEIPQPVEVPQPAEKEKKTMAAKYTVKEAIEALKKFPDDADVRGFSSCKVTPKTVSFKVNAPEPAPEQTGE